MQKVELKSQYPPLNVEKLVCGYTIGYILYLLVRQGVK